METRLEELIAIRNFVDDHIGFEGDIVGGLKSFGFVCIWRRPRLGDLSEDGTGVVRIGIVSTMEAAQLLMSLAVTTGSMFLELPVVEV